MKLRKFFLLFALVALLGGVFGVQAQSAQTLTVFAASSLTDAFNEIGAAFEAANPGVKVSFSYGSSSTLATQLVDGAPADLFASANARQMGVASDGGRIAKPTHTFAKNRLVLIVPSDNPARITTLHDLANPGVKLVLAAPAVPVRDYTDAMLKLLTADPAYGDAYAAAFKANVVSEEDNVRQVSAKVSLGEADAGIVYSSDVTPDIADKVTRITIPDAVNTLATYPIGVTNNAADPALAQKFVDTVLSDAGQDVLVKWGFISIRIPVLDATVTLPKEPNVTAVSGQVFNPYTLTVADLQKDFTAKTADVSFLSGTDTTKASFTGPSLWDVIAAAQPNFNADVRNDKLSMYLVVTGSDGYQAVIAWGEIDPDLANQPILLAYEQDGKPLDLPRLVVPSDGHGSRYVSGVVDISLRDAPTVAR